MKITAFEGNKGDCLLLTSSNAGSHILVDGGLVSKHFDRVDSYSDNVAPYLGDLRSRGAQLDLICVSHIDQDHIGGVLQLLDDLFAWRVFDHQHGQGLDVAEPKNPRPPEIGGIWHNSFHEQADLNRRDIHDAIAAAMPRSLLLGLGARSHGEDFFGDLATSMMEAAQLSRRIGARQMNIPLNVAFDGKLVMQGSQPDPIAIGEFAVTVLCPTAAHLKALRDKWNTWLDTVKGARQIAGIVRDAERDEALLRSGELDLFIELAVLGPAVGDRASVTEENVASIVMLVEEAGKSVLMTGDARDDHIIDGLVASGRSSPDGHIHVDVLKIQHHGSENNYSEGFGKRVTADHYIFCGNGKHENPDTRVVRRLIDSRLGPASRRSPNPQAANPFDLWFTSDGTTSKADPHHMREVVDLVRRREANSAGRMTAHFSNGSHFCIEL